MGRIFNFGGLEYKVVDKKLLHGMDYYYVLEHVQTHNILYLCCLPETN